MTEEFTFEHRYFTDAPNLVREFTSWAIEQGEDFEVRWASMPEKQDDDILMTIGCNCFHINITPDGIHIRYYALPTPQHYRDYVWRPDTTKVRPSTVIRRLFEDAR